MGSHLQVCEQVKKMPALRLAASLGCDTKPASWRRGQTQPEAPALEWDGAQGLSYPIFEANFQFISHKV
jgi:hypothetical protein